MLRLSGNILTLIKETSKPPNFKSFFFVCYFVIKPVRCVSTVRTESQWLNRPERKCACLIFIFKTSRHQLWICLKRKCIAGCFNVAPLLPSASIAMNNQAWGEQKCFSAAPAPTINTFFLLCSQSGKDKRRECDTFSATPVLLLLKPSFQFIWALLIYSLAIHSC